MIQIIDNFLSKEDFKNIHAKSTHVKFLSNDVTYETIKDEDINHVWFTSDAANDIKNIFLKKIPKLLDIEIVDIPVCKWTMVTKKKQIEEHVDDKYCDLQTIFYVNGNSNINSGTGFYTKEDKFNRLSTIAGFEPNRLVIWDSKIWHAPLSFANDFMSRISIITQYKIRRKNVTGRNSNNT